jgi:hypothetical protein
MPTELGPHDLTSDTSHPPFVVSASVSASGGDTYTPAWQAFDGNTTSSGWLGNTSSPWLLKIDLGSAQVLGSYAILVTDPDLSRAPLYWSVYGGNDGVNWALVDSQVSQTTTWTAGGPANTFTCASPGNFRYYLFELQSSGDPTYCGIGELYLYEGVLPAGTTSQTISFPPLSDFVLSSPNTGTFSLEATCDSGLQPSFAVTSGPAAIYPPYSLTVTGPGTVTVTASQGGDATYAAATPVRRTFTVTASPELGPHDLTGDTSHPPFVVSASSELNDAWQAWRAFDGVVGPAATAGWSGAGPGPEWLQIDLGSAGLLYRYSIGIPSGQGIAIAPRQWTMQGSNDGTAWTILDTVTVAEQNWGVPGTVRLFLPYPAVEVSYRYYQLNITANDGAPTVMIAELSLYTVPAPPATAWLVISEPGLGPTDRSAYMSFADGATHSFTLQLRRRGQASIPLIVLAGDPYAPTLGTLVKLYDLTSDGSYGLVFVGTIDLIEIAWLGDAGDRMCTVTAVSLEQVFDAILIPPRLYLNQTPDYIVRDLLTSLCVGAPVTAGSIMTPTLAGNPVIVPSLVCNYDRVSAIFDKMATAGLFVWGVDPATQTLFFMPPATTPAPWVVESEDGLWESWNWKQTRQDYRNRQIVRGSADMIPPSGEFIRGTGQLNITLMRAVLEVKAAYATNSTPNTAIATFSANPAPGDTFTTGVYNVVWQATRVYALGGLVIDTNGYIQKVTTAGTSGGSYPPYSTVTTVSIVDGSVAWTCEGPQGLSTGDQTYTFVAVLDNRQFGQILIGATAGDTAWNTVQGWNAADAAAPYELRGVVFSMPTWENDQTNAINFDLPSASFTVQEKAAGSGWLTRLSTTGSGAFSFNAGTTFDGTDAFDTITLNIGVQGTVIAAPGLAYTPGSAAISLATPLNAGSNLNVFYTRAGGDVIIVEDTAGVLARAAIEGGTGKYQQIVSDTSNTDAAAVLLEAQQDLAAYDVLPVSFRFVTFRAGLTPGLLLTLTLASPGAATNPQSAGRLTGGGQTWIVQEVSAELVPAQPSMPMPGCGHYRYTVTVIDSAQVGDYLAFWTGLSAG